MADTTTTQSAEPDTSTGRSHDLRTLHRYVAAAVLWYGLFLILPSDLQGPWWVFGGFGTALVSYFRVRQLPNPIRLPATLMLVAGTFSLLGGVVRGVQSLITGE